MIFNSVFLGWFEVADEHNTNVYVSNLPNDITDEEFVELMSKCGIIMKDPENGKLKMKLYRDYNGQLKGDGRCCYIKVRPERKIIFFFFKTIFKIKRESLDTESAVSLYTESA